MMDNTLKDMLQCAVERELDKALGLAFYGTSVRTEPGREDFTLEKMCATIRKLKEDLGPPLPTLKASSYATVLPDKKPHTLDMQLLVERVGVQPRPAAFRLKTSEGEMVVYHPDLLNSKQ